MRHRWVAAASRLAFAALVASAQVGTTVAQRPSGADPNTSRPPLILAAAPEAARQGIMELGLSTLLQALQQGDPEAVESVLRDIAKGNAAQASCGSPGQLLHLLKSVGSSPKAGEPVVPLFIDQVRFRDSGSMVLSDGEFVIRRAGGRVARTAFHLRFDKVEDRWASDKEVLDALCKTAGH